MPSTYEPIATTTLSSAASGVTFSSIPATYTDLVIVAKAGGVAAANLYIWFNGSRGTSYSGTTLTGDGSAVTSQRSGGTGDIILNYYGYMSTDLNTVYTVNIFNYANSSINKTLLSRSNNTNNGLAGAVGVWRNTSAITSIDLAPGGSNLLAGSTFTLYGIKAA
jgi:hypothetical protein